MKRCCRCKKEKLLTEFHKATKNKDGLQRRCAECNKEVAGSYYKNDINGAKSKHKLRAKQRIQQFYDRLNVIKSEQGCKVCFENDACVLDFHHLDPTQKENDISHIAQSKSWRLMEKELLKCIVICSNCHRRYHAGRFSLLTDKPSS